jgi:hypothetical protein
MVDIFGGTMQVCGGGVLIELMVYIYFLFSFFFLKIYHSIGRIYIRFYIFNGKFVHFLYGDDLDGKK